MRKLLVALVVTSFCFPAFAVNENNYDKRIEKAYNYFSYFFQEESFTGAEDVNIEYAKSEGFLTQFFPRNAIVILPGRTEGYIKYVELAYDLRRLTDECGLDFNVYLMDHRGQGFSDRLIEDGHKGHVRSFDNYVDDVSLFINDIVKPVSKKVYVIGHSLGGAIATQLMQESPDLVDKAVLSSPMLQINTYPYTEDEALGAVTQLVSFGMGTEYFPGQGPRSTGIFEESIVTTSESRWNNWEYTILGEDGLYPEMAVGGPTNLWGKEAIEATKAMRANAELLETKILLLQAGADLMVINPAQNAVCEAAQDCTLVVIEGAKHEILMEADSIRKGALKKIKKFLRRN